MSLARPPEIMTTALPNGRERERTHAHRSDTASSHTSSPLRTVPSFSVSVSPPSSGNPAQPSSQPVTLEALLGTHAGAADPALSALEALVTDRNTLAVQNAQLWKLVEKQRGAYGKLMKEVERIRGEREAYRSRLQALGENTDALLRAHRRQEKKDGVLRASASHSQMRLTEGAPVGPGDGRLETRQHLTRAYSDENAPRLSEKNPYRARDASIRAQESYTSLNGSTSSLTYPPGQGSHTREAASSQTARNHHHDAGSSHHVPTSSIPSLSEGSGEGRATPSSVSESPVGSSTSTAVTSPAVSAVQIDIADPILGPYQPPQVRSNGVPPQMTSMLVTPATPSASGASTTRAPDSIDSPLRTAVPPLQQSGASTSLSPHAVIDSSRPYVLSRDSRVSLPEEAKRYYATMDNSPRGSPLNNSFGPGISSAANSPLRTHAPQFPDAPQTKVEEILDLGDEDSTYDTSIASSTVESSGRTSTAEDPGWENDEGVHESADTVRRKVKGHHAVAEDFPLPPSTTPATGLMQVPASPRTPTSPFPLAAGPPQMTFRALPLLAADLPHTTIQVVSSTIRPNERGKEVLCFVVLVDPGRGKEPWKVEKLYSDVLGLDARLRDTWGKSVAKKMPPLPEGRLLRDHAPAKVDQRKMALEQYLRSLIALPVKNKDEVIAFFTSDIVKAAHKPVAQAGYKEGYLTKRGKNFGGWKMRYFVLQGPSLEYYENRGGAHLGSITITGAQIGRQQKAADKREADDDSEYRHAFLIIEGRRGPTGSSPRHVLCAGSDEERDRWVEELVRYVSGTYSEDQIVVVPSEGIAAAANPDAPPRASTSSSTAYDMQSVASTPSKAKTDNAKPSAASISELPPHAGNQKLFPNAAHYADDTSSTSSPAKSSPVAAPSPVDHFLAAEQHLSSSLPTASASPLANEDVEEFNPGQRANSELGHYPDLVDPKAAQKAKEKKRSNRMSVNPLKAAIPERAGSPEKDNGQHTPRVDVNGKVKISGPMNGIPIPAGYNFGSKDHEATMSPSSKRADKTKSRGFWTPFRPHEKQQATPTRVPRAVFNVPLEESLDVAQIAGLPAIVFRCIQYLETKQAEQEEGIYRLSGSSAVIKALKDRCNQEGDIDLLGSDEYWDPHAIAGLLKTFLRDLPASILTRDLHLRFLAVIDFVDPHERIRELSRLVASLPTANYTLLRALTAHLILIVQNANINKMTMRNVGIVFSPTLGIPAGVFSLMLSEFTRVFSVDGVAEEAGEPSEAGQGEEDAAVDRRNSRHYSDAAADQLLGLSGRTLAAAPPDAEDAPSDDGEEVSIVEESVADTENDSDVVESSGASSSAHLAYEQGSADSHLLAPGGDYGHLQPPGGDFSHLQPPGGDYSHLQAPGADYSLHTPTKSRVAHLAASRGLNIISPQATDKAGRRRSHVIGLPVSPRPHSSPRTPLNESSSAGHSPVPSSPLPPGAAGS